MDESTETIVLAQRKHYILGMCYSFFQYSLFYAHVGDVPSPTNVVWMVRVARFVSVGRLSTHPQCDQNSPLQSPNLTPA
eukprot:5294874-Amphidinium_carterae.1